MKPSFFIGAYAASPQARNPHIWNPVAEGEYFRALGELKSVGGLELPFQGALHPHDPAWLLEHFNPRWKAVLTPLPGTMERLRLDPTFGLASTSESGRRAALEFIRSAQTAVHQLNQKFGKKTVVAVQLHSAPNQLRAKASLHSFVESLQEIQCWDWQGAELWIEHCDQFIAGQTPAKGFLGLDEEMTAVHQLGSPFGISLNWGRSVLEVRSPEGALEHLDSVGSQGLLKALIFSGACETHPLYGNWEDSHAPFANPEMKSRDPTGFERLFLTEARVIEALQMLPAEAVLGLKIQPLPATLSLEDRIHWVKESVSFLNFCMAAAKREAR
ncbi:MAG: DUF4862 family protein [Methylotenera sp.]|nr:DUF4862 family protein [Oligoflexia bacterium]